MVLSWQPLQSLLWTLRHDQKHICANLILRVAFIRHADCCSGIFLFLIFSLPPSFLLLSLHHQSQGFPLLFTCFSPPPFPLLSLSPSLSLSPFFFSLHPCFDSGCASLGGEDGAPQTLEGYWGRRNTGLRLSMRLHCEHGLIVRARPQRERTKGHGGSLWRPNMKGAPGFNEDQPKIPLTAALWELPASYTCEFPTHMKVLPSL